MAFALALLIAAAGPAAAQGENYPDKKAITVNLCPYVELTSFQFSNEEPLQGRPRFEMRAYWKNIGTQPVIAFEIVVLKYDPFNRREMGTRWIVTGHDSANWKPLGPGETATDGTIGFGTEDTFTAIAYIRAARLANGEVWHVDTGKLREQVAKAAPFLREPGDLMPDAPVKKQ